MKNASFSTLQNSQCLEGCDHFLFLLFFFNYFFPWLWKKHLFWCDLQHKISVLVGQLLHALAFLFSPAEREKTEGEEEKKQESKPKPLPTLQTKAEKAATEVWVVSNTRVEWVECVFTAIHYEKIWRCERMDFSTFWINEDNKMQTKILPFFLPHQEIVPIVQQA